MSKSRVPQWGKPQGYVTVDTAATEGATFGVNLRWPNGALVRREDLAGAVGGGNDRPVVLWELVQKVPVNVKGLAAATGEGVYRIGPGGAGATNTTTTHLPEGDNLYFTEERARAVAGGFVPTFTNSTFIVPENTQALFVLPIELGDEGALVVDGALIEVSP